MASVTLAESAKLCQDELVQGVIENVISIDQSYGLLPFQGIDGNAISYDRENALGTVQAAGVGDTITAKEAATFTKVSTALTTLIGDAEVNGLIQATRSGVMDQTSVQIASKAKNLGRYYQNYLINGTGASDQFSGLLALCASGQKVTTATDGAALSFALLDELCDLVKAKNGQVDFIMMPLRTRRAYKTLLRALGGSSADEVYTMPNGANVIAFNGIPIFANEWIPVDQTQGATDTCTSVIAGVFDDGSQKVGVAGLTAKNEAGISVEYAGMHATKDEKIWRVKWYASLAVYSEKAIAVLPGITN